MSFCFTWSKLLIFSLFWKSVAHWLIKELRTDEHYHHMGSNLVWSSDQMNQHGHQHENKNILCSSTNSLVTDHN